MIGHYLGTLSTEQEDRVLTTAMRCGNALSWEDHELQCLVSTAIPGARAATLGAIYRPSVKDFSMVANLLAEHYDGLCCRFGERRVNAAIRNRILTNRWWRANAAQSPPAFREALESISGEVERVHP